MKGIESQKKQPFIIARYCKFGKFILNHYKLSQNILLIKYPKSLAPFSKIKATVISDNFKNLLTDLIHTNVINIDLQKSLNDSEIKIFDLLIFSANLSSHLNYKKQTRTIDDYVKRYNLLLSSLKAGDDSIELRDEISNIIKLLNNKNVDKISDDIANELLELLKY